MIKKIYYFILSTFSLFFPSLALAQADADSGQIIDPTVLPDVTIIQIIQAVVKFILIVAFVAAFIMLLIGGIRWILAGGDEKAVSSARSTITAALIGLVIVLLAFAIIKLVETFFHVCIISGTITIPTVDSGVGPVATGCSN